MTKLTKNFDYYEFDKRGEGDATVRENIAKLAGVMQIVRNRIGSRIVITSGYRSVQRNKAVGGVKNSAHLTGLACDFICPGFTGQEIGLATHLALLQSNTAFDQVIYYPERGHVHLAIGEPGRAMFFNGE